MGSFQQRGKRCQRARWCCARAALRSRARVFCCTAWGRSFATAAFFYATKASVPLVGVAREALWLPRACRRKRNTDSDHDRCIHALHIHLTPWFTIESITRLAHMWSRTFIGFLFLQVACASHIYCRFSLKQYCSFRWHEAEKPVGDFCKHHAVPDEAVPTNNGCFSPMIDASFTPYTDITVLPPHVSVVSPPHGILHCVDIPSRA